MIGLPLGLLFANAGEWVIHKHLLHEIGKDKRSIWSFHWYEHHRECRRGAMVDPFYLKGWLVWGPKVKEALSLLLATVLVTPLFWVAPWFAAALWFSVLRYYVAHKRAHLDPAWARANLRCHYDHHMGKNQNANWCVTSPWFDYVSGTRIRYEFDASGRVISERRGTDGLTFKQRYLDTLFGEVEPRSDATTEGDLLGGHPAGSSQSPSPSGRLAV